MMRPTWNMHQLTHIHGQGYDGPVVTSETKMWDSCRSSNEMWESREKLLRGAEGIIWVGGRSGRELLWELLSSINKWLTGSRGMCGHGWSQAHSGFITHSLVWQFSPGNLSLSQARKNTSKTGKDSTSGQRWDFVCVCSNQDCWV